MFSLKMYKAINRQTVVIKEKGLETYTQFTVIIVILSVLTGKYYL